MHFVRSETQVGKCTGRKDVFDTPSDAVQDLDVSTYCLSRDLTFIKCHYRGFVLVLRKGLVRGVSVDEENSNIRREKEFLSV